MAPKIFLTGATGYIGGDVLYLIHKEHADYEFALLIRSEEKAKPVREAYPDARIVIGDLNDSATIEQEASLADIVIHTADASDHEESAKAIAKGLIKGHSPDKPGFWLHTGGTGILTYFDTQVTKTYGELNPKVFNDWEGVGELTSLPSAAFHRNVDEIVLETGTKHADVVKTALICPPTIFGPGRGPVSGRSRQVYEMTSFILEEQYTPRIGRGHSRMNNVHIHDLSRLYALVVEAALSPSQKNNKEIWGANGYFFCENGEHTWGDLAETISQEARKQGFTGGKTLETRDLPFEDALNSSAGFERASWGLNSRGSAVRARKVLGWETREHSLEAEIPSIVRSEAARIGLLS